MISDDEKNLNNKDEEINIESIYNFIFRNRKIISIFSFSVFFISCIFAFTQKRIWAGNFQIVLKENSNSSLESKGNALSIFDVFNDQNLETEVAILESQAILMPVFQYSNELKKKANPKFKEPLFDDWSKDNLIIKLKNRTDVLKIIYKDKEKSIIIPVLEKMSKAYQEYSLRKKRRSIELLKEYLEDRINIYQTKSKNSFKKAQEFAIEEDLAILSIGQQINEPATPDLFNSISRSLTGLSDDFTETASTDTSTTKSNINVEAVRVESANRLREIDLQLKQVKKIKDPTEFRFVETSSYLYNGQLRKNLEEIEEQIAKYEMIYTDLNPSLSLLRKRRTLLLENMKSQSITFLNNQKRILQARIKAATRPKEVLTNYKSLIREASRDEKILIQLEEQLTSIELEEAKKEDPWELITVANLKPNPVAPSRTRIGLAGLFSGFLFGLIIAYWKDKKSDLIFYEDKLESITGAEIIEKIRVSNEEFQKYSKIVFLNEILSEYQNKNIAFISSKNILEKDCEFLFNILLKNNFKFELKQSFNQIDKKDIIFFITNLETLQTKELLTIINRLKSMSKKINKIMLLTN